MTQVLVAVCHTRTVLSKEHVARRLDEGPGAKLQSNIVSVCPGCEDQSCSCAATSYTTTCTRQTAPSGHCFSVAEPPPRWYHACSTHAAAAFAALCVQYITHRAILEGDQRPAGAREELQALCRRIANPQVVLRLLLAHIPNLQDACIQGPQRTSHRVRARHKQCCRRLSELHHAGCCTMQCPACCRTLSAHLSWC